jgi:predicted DCC family thiol-disulfide oxidoreductase YuxK
VKKLYVLYDGACEFCIRCRRWLERQPKFLDLVFVPAATAAARRRFPALRGVERADELVVISDGGGVYRGARAWIMCLWALHEYREWSATLSSPAVMPLAKRAFELLSNNRRWVSSFLGPSEEQLWNEIRSDAGEEFGWGGTLKTIARKTPRPEADDVVIVEEPPPPDPKRGCRGSC